MVLAIGFYRRLIRPRLARRCLFRVSCSEHVLRMTQAHGVVVGARALRKRFLRCRGGYELLQVAGERGLQVRLADGTIVDRSEIAESVLDPLKP